MANLPTGVFDDVNLTKGGFYTHINTLIDFLSGAIGANGTKDGVKIHLELDSVDNTSDISKPISTLTQAALDEKVSLLDLSSAIPSKIIVMWGGLVTAIPVGWNLCDGTNGTPDLRERFVFGASVNDDVNDLGGSADAVVVSHTHSGSTNTTGSHNHTLSVNSSSWSGTGSGGSSLVGYLQNLAAPDTTYAGAHSHTVTVNSAGESGVGKNLPPFMKLAYIQKA